MATTLDELVSRVRFDADDSGLVKTKRGMAQIRQDAGATIAKVTSVRSALLQLWAGGAILHGAKAAVGSVVEVNRSFDSLRASLKTVTGTAGRADAAFGEIRKFAKETPFQVEEVTQAFVKLKALGLSPSSNALRSYGNTASAMGKSLNDMIEAVADATTGENERLKEFGIKAKTEGDKVTYTFQGVSTTVGKNAVEIENYLQRIGNTTFGGAMKEQMGTLNGAFSNLEDSLAAFAVSIGEGGLNDALKEAAGELGAMVGEGSDLGTVLGEVLGDGVRGAVKYFKALIERLREIKREDIKKFFEIVGKTIDSLVDKLKFLVDNWEVVLSVVAGVKTVQGFNAVAGGLQMIGIRAGAALGPIGLIAGAFVALLPHAMALGEALGDVAHGMSEVGREQQKLENKQGGRTGTRGGVRSYASPEHQRAIERAQADIGRLSKEALGGGNRVKASMAADKLKEAKARLRRAQAKNTEEWDRREAEEAKLAGVRKESDDYERRVYEGVAIGKQLRKEFTGKAKSSKIDEVAIMLAKGEIDEGQARALLGAKDKDKHKKGKKHKEVKSEAMDKIDSRIEEIVKAEELKAYLESRDLMGPIREAWALEAGRAKRVELRRAVDEGRLSALGGEFAPGATGKLLKDAGLIDDISKAAPPVLTVTIVKAQVKIDAPITIDGTRLGSAADLMHELGRIAQRKLDENVERAVREALPMQRR